MQFPRHGDAPHTRIIIYQFTDHSFGKRPFFLCFAHDDFSRLVCFFVFPPETIPFIFRRFFCFGRARSHPRTCTLKHTASSTHPCVRTLTRACSLHLTYEVDFLFISSVSCWLMHWLLRSLCTAFGVSSSGSSFVVRVAFSYLWIYGPSLCSHCSSFLYRLPHCLTVCIFLIMNCIS